MARPHNILTVLKLRKLRNKPGRHNDGRSLHLYVQSNNNASWIFRYRDRVTGKLRDKGLGSFEEVSLERARAKAAECRMLLSDGNDPIESARSNVKARRLAHESRITFKQCFEHHLANIKDGFRNKKHSAQWSSTITTHCAALLARPVTEIDTNVVVEALRPIWLKLPETARRVRQRIEAVMDWARANKRYSGENPARLKGHLDKLLPLQPKDVEHRAAVPYGEMADFVAKLSQVDTIAARALMLQILTALRPSEAINAKWSEFDLGKMTWTVPKERMKKKRAHEVPIAPRLAEMLNAMPRDGGDLLFPGTKGKPITTAATLKLVKQLFPSDSKITCHGFRSSFRDWAGAISTHPSEIAEAALAHVIKSKTEAAYNRDNLFAKRSVMMRDWEDYCFASVSGSILTDPKT